MSKSSLHVAEELQPEEDEEPENYMIRDNKKTSIFLRKTIYCMTKMWKVGKCTEVRKRAISWKLLWDKFGQFLKQT